MARYLAPLQIHVAYSEAFAQGLDWSTQLQQWFGGRVGLYALPEPNIPVLIWSDRKGGVPPDIDWAEAQRTALLVLVDDSMAGSEAWRLWYRRQVAAMRSTDRVLTCAATRHYKNIAAEASQTVVIPLFNVAALARSSDLLLSATHAITRLLTGDKVKLFISHARRQLAGVSGEELARLLKSFADGQPAGRPFFDETQVAPGDDIEQALESAFDGATVVVVLTDPFSSRFWCGWEVATAKHKGCPIVVVDALEQGEVVSLAYLGKTPTIRWNATAPEAQRDIDMHRRIVSAALLEQLRLRHDRLQLEAIAGLMPPTAVRVEVMGRPPELATLPEAVPQQESLLLHADPPLPRYELTLIRRQRRDVSFASATQALAGRPEGTPALQGKRIAVSISDSPDREENGLSKELQERLWTQLTTHLLAAGAQLAYGGDFRSGGYTTQLRDLLRSLADLGQPVPDGVVHWYVGWPQSARLSDGDKASLPSAFRLHLAPGPPGGLKNADPTRPANDPDPEHGLGWTLGMRDMRRAMADECDARVLVGGQLRGVSPWPGVLEEFETSLRKPIYLAGAFGGTTAAIIGALRGERPAPFTQEFQDGDRQERAPLRQHYEGKMGKIDWDGRVARLNELGKRPRSEWLKNGLSDEDDRRLAVTRNLTEIVALVLRGLRAAWKE
jgi:hypothetical protein